MNAETGSTLICPWVTARNRSVASPWCVSGLSARRARFIAPPAWLGKLIFMFNGQIEFYFMQMSWFTMCILRALQSWEEEWEFLSLGFAFVTDALNKYLPCKNSCTIYLIQKLFIAQILSTWQLSIAPSNVKCTQVNNCQNVNQAICAFELQGNHLPHHPPLFSGGADFLLSVF